MKEKENMLDPSLENKNEEIIENSLRPRCFKEYIGQEKVKENMKIYIKAAKNRAETLDHVLLCGPPGLRENYPCKYYFNRNEI